MKRAMSTDLENRSFRAAWTMGDRTQPPRALRSETEVYRALVRALRPFHLSTFTF
jgi:hypothetical protein